MSETWIPIAFFFFVCFGSSLYLYWRYLTTAKQLDTIVKLAEQGGEVKPDMLKFLSREGGTTADLRKGLIWIGIGLPLTLGLLANIGVHAAVFGLAPVFIGFAYLAVRKYGYKNDGTLLQQT